MTYAGGVTWRSRNQEIINLLLEKARPFPTESFGWEISTRKDGLYGLLIIRAGCFDAAIRRFPCAHWIGSRRLPTIRAMAQGAFLQYLWGKSADLGAGTIDAMTFAVSRGRWPDQRNRLAQPKQTDDKNDKSRHSKHGESTESVTLAEQSTFAQSERLRKPGATNLAELGAVGDQP